MIFMLDILLQAFLKHFSSFLSMLWNSVFFWRSVALVFAAMIAALIIYRKKLLVLIEPNNHKSHDINIFKNGNEILDESKFKSFINNIQDNHGFYAGQKDCLSDFCRYFKAESNQYLTNNLNKLAKIALNRFNELLDFIGINFFSLNNLSTPNGRQYYCMQPELNIDRCRFPETANAKKYKEYAFLLYKLCDKSHKAFVDYRRYAKKALQI